MPSLNVGEGSIDYSDFRHQHIHATFENKGDKGDQIEALHQYEPVDLRGLSNDEGAELVYLDAAIKIGYDGFKGTSNTKPGGAEVRGIFGSDLSAESTQLPGSDGPNGETIVVKEDTAGGGSGSDARGGFGDDSIFGSFNLDSIVPHQDTVNQQAGGGSLMFDRLRIPFREVYGRGPFFDFNDSFDVFARVIKNECSFGVEAACQTRLVWDVVELDDANQRFSIPSDD